MLNRRIRVVHVVANLCDGGAESLVRALTPRLVSEFVEVVVVAIYPSRLGPDEKRRLGVPVFEIERHGRGDVGALWRVTRALRELKPDVVHAHVHSGKYLGRLAAILAGVPVIILTEHDSDPPAGPVHATCDRLLNARTSAIVTFSERQRNRVVHETQVGRERVVVIPNGIPIGRPVEVLRDEVRRTLGVAPNEFALLYPGRLSIEKNQQLAIRSMARLRMEVEVPVRLFLAGDGPDETALRRLTMTLGLVDCVTFLGRRDDIPSLLRSVDMVLISSRREAMPIAAIEAMHGGAPIVSTPWEGAEAFFQGAALIASGWEPADVARAIKQAILDPVVRELKAIRAKRIAAERYNIAATAEAHQQLYAMLVDAKA